MTKIIQILEGDEFGTVTTVSHLDLLPCAPLSVLQQLRVQGLSVAAKAALGQMTVSEGADHSQPA